MQRIYIYKCVVDDGGAPCIDHGILSLCICKPMIRSTARVGDVIFAFGSNSESPANPIVYIARVTRKLTGGKYYDLDEFKYRGDCIYQRTRAGRFRVRADAKYHSTPTALARDLGPAPDYRRANCLVSIDFRYFGDNGRADWKRHAPALAELIESLGQGHRVKHPELLRAELLTLKNAIWQAHSKKVLGKPLHKPDIEIHHDDDENSVTACRHRCHDVKAIC